MLRNNEALLSAFLEQLPSGVGLFDPQGHWLISNSALRNLMSDTIPSNDPENSWRWQTWGADGHLIKKSEWPGARALRGENVIFGLDFLYTSDDGREIWKRVSSVPFLSDSGEIKGVITVIQDIDKQKRAEEALCDSEERYRAFFNTSAVGTVEINLKGQLTKVNDRYCQITGYSREELLGMNVVELSHPDDRDYDRMQLVDYLNGGTPSFDVEKRYVRKDGRMIWVQVTASMVFDKEGRPLRSTGVVQDITERKRFEEVLQESEKRFRALVTTSSEVVYSMSPDWSEMNQLYGRGFLADTENPSRSWLQEYILPEDQPHVIAVINEAIRTKSVFELEHRVRQADGSVGWVLSRAVPLLDANGEIVEWFGAASDVTERKQAEEKLQEAMQEKSLILDNINASIAFHDIDNCLVWANKFYLESIGKHTSELKGRKCHDCWGLDRPASGRRDDARESATLAAGSRLLAGSGRPC
jgi:PAS domain S-box-containing protein